MPCAARSVSARSARSEWGEGEVMRDRRLACCLLSLIPLLFPTLGCQILHPDPDIVVLVRDAETKMPLSSAEVYLCPRLKDDTIDRCEATALTRTDGLAHVAAKAAGAHGVAVQAIASGHLPETRNVSADDLKKIASLPQSPKGEERPADVVVEAYAEPAFSVELLAPPGYRGLIEVEIALRDSLPHPVGQRCYQYAVQPSGLVRIEGPTLLQRVAVADYRARYAGRPLLTSTMDAETVGFRWLRGAGGKHYFVLGTQLDYEKLQRRMLPEQHLTSDAWEDPSQKENRGKYRYGKITNKAEESARR
jgi:hypothetical protein